MNSLSINTNLGIVKNINIGNPRKSSIRVDITLSK